MAALSYKSTSLISFALAAAASFLLFAATRRSASGNARTAGVIVTLSTATLGFYVMQSLTSSLWRPRLQYVARKHAGQPKQPGSYMYHHGYRH